MMALEQLPRKVENPELNAFCGATSTFAARKRKWQRASPSIRMLPSDSESKLEWRDWHDRDR